MFGDWTARNKRANGTVHRQLEGDAGRAKSKQKVRPEQKVRPGYEDLSFLLEGTRDVIITGGSSAEHLCGKDRARRFTCIISLLLTTALCDSPHASKAQGG